MIIFLGVAVVVLGFIVLVAFGGLNEKIEILEFQVEDLKKACRDHENDVEDLEKRVYQYCANINRDCINLYNFLDVKRNSDGKLEKIERCKTCNQEIKK